MPNDEVRIALAAWVRGRKKRIFCAQTGRHFKGKKVPPKKAMGVITKLANMA